MRIEKKIWPESLKRMQSSNERLHLRLADFRCKPGDTLVLREWNPRTRRYTGRSIERRIRNVTKINVMKFYKKADLDRYGLQVISF